MTVKSSILLLIALCASSSGLAQNTRMPQPPPVPNPEAADAPALDQEAADAQPYAWKILPPLGLREPSTIDTLYMNYAQRFVPSMVTDAYGTTGNYGAPGRTLILF